MTKLIRTIDEIREAAMQEARSMPRIPEEQWNQIVLLFRSSRKAAMKEEEVMPEPADLHAQLMQINEELRNARAVVERLMAKKYTLTRQLVRTGAGYQAPEALAQMDKRVIRTAGHIGDPASMINW